MKLIVDVASFKAPMVRLLLGNGLIQQEDITLTNSRAERAEGKLTEAEDRIEELLGELAFVTAELNSSREISSEGKQECKQREAPQAETVSPPSQEKLFAQRWELLCLESSVEPSAFCVAEMIQHIKGSDALYSAKWVELCERFGFPPNAHASLHRLADLCVRGQRNT